MASAPEKEAWCVEHVIGHRATDIDNAKFRCIRGRVVLVLEGGWHHLRLEGATAKIIGLQGDNGESPQVRIAGHGAVMFVDCHVRTVEIKGEVRVYR